MTAREELAQEWRERLEDFAQSEMTVQTWCNFNRVSLHQTGFKGTLPCS